MPIETRDFYDQNMRTELDIIAQKDYAVKQGRAEGRAERNVEIAKAMLKDGLETEKVMAYTGLSRKEIEALK
jgi:predicted transposase/invertase (TIGR01784 family)